MDVFGRRGHVAEYSILNYKPIRIKNSGGFLILVDMEKECCRVVGRLRQSVAGRGLVSGSRRNEVPKGGWSEAELCRVALQTYTCIKDKEVDPMANLL